MLRRCDGTDPNLLREVPQEPAHEGPQDRRPVVYEPCTCRKVFDDVSHLVIYPHTAF